MSGHQAGDAYFLDVTYPDRHQTRFAIEAEAGRSLTAVLRRADGGVVAEGGSRDFARLS